jgi:hypothetical protein
MGWDGWVTYVAWFHGGVWRNVGAGVGAYQGVCVVMVWLGLTASGYEDPTNGGLMNIIIYDEGYVRTFCWSAGLSER